MKKQRCAKDGEHCIVAIDVAKSFRALYVSPQVFMDEPDVDDENVFIPSLGSSSKGTNLMMHRACRVFHKPTS